MGDVHGRGVDQLDLFNAGTKSGGVPEHRGLAVLVSYLQAVAVVAQLLPLEGDTVNSSGVGSVILAGNAQRINSQGNSTGGAGGGLGSGLGSCGLGGCRLGGCRSVDITACRRIGRTTGQVNGDGLPVHAVAQVVLKLHKGVGLSIGGDGVGLGACGGAQLGSVSIVIQSITEGEDLCIGVGVGDVHSGGVDQLNLYDRSAKSVGVPEDRGLAVLVSYLQAIAVVAQLLPLENSAVNALGASGVVLGGNTQRVDVQNDDALGFTGQDGVSSGLGGCGSGGCGSGGCGSGGSGVAACGMLGDSAGCTVSLLQSEGVDSGVGAHAVAGQVAAVNFQVLGLVVVVGNSALNEVAAFSNFQNELGVVALGGNELNVGSVAGEEVAVVSLEGDNAALTLNHGESDSFGLIFAKYQLHLLGTAGGSVLIFCAGGVLVVGGQLNDDLVSSGSFELGGHKVEGNRGGVAVCVGDGSSQGELNIFGGLLGYVDLLESGGRTVSQLNRISGAGGNFQSPSDVEGLTVNKDRGNYFKVSGLNRNFVLVSGLIGVKHQGLCVIQVAYSGSGGLIAGQQGHNVTAGEQAQAQGQQENQGNKLLHNFTPFLCLLNFNIVRGENFDLIVTAEVIYDAGDCNGFA